MNLWIGEILVQTGMDLGRWAITVEWFRRMRNVSAMVGPFYIVVSY